MKKEVLIQIKGLVQEQDGDSIELVTAGTLYQKNQQYYLVYKESELMGMQECSTTIKVGEDKVVLLRYGKEHHSQMTFEKNAKHINGYDTPYGSLLIGVRTINLEKNINLQGGNIEIEYELEVNHMVMDHHHLSITVTETKVS